MMSKIFLVCLLAFIVVVDAQIQAKERVPVPCTNDEMCNENVRSTMRPRCSGTFCMCPNMTTHEWEFCTPKDHGHMVGAKPTDLNTHCEHDYECANMKNAICQSGLCICGPHYVMSAINATCLKIAPAPSADCTESTQCVAGFGQFAECATGKCRCKNGMHFVELPSQSRCVSTRGYGAKCTKEEHSCYQASQDGTKNLLECSNDGTCKCIKNSAFVDGLCQGSGTSQIVPQLLILGVLVAAVFSFY